MSIILTKLILIHCFPLPTGKTEQNEIERKQVEIDQGQDINQELVVTNFNLAQEKAFNRKFEEAQAQFTEKEAMVYKQGTTLMIRLKGLEFPVAKAVLKGENFPLLAKVQKIIADFGENSVVIEGHTDSNGGMKLNEKLSSERAAAVKEYLISNSPNKTMNISAIGYGYQKPLATNKTASGRAQNRRVDILIQPQASQKL